MTPGDIPLSAEENEVKTFFRKPSALLTQLNSRNALVSTSINSKDETM
jgi:hypothetical protein